MNLGAFIATAILLIASEGWITEEQMETAYSPFVWCCMKIPYFVIYHEWWIDVLADMRNGLRAMFTRREF